MADEFDQGSAGRQCLALITARGGSKGLPGKNIMSVNNVPLIAYTIQAAQEASCIDRVVLSSDDAEIIKTARDWQCDVPFTRPVELASDETSSMDVVMHALEQLPGFDYIILLQPTSPLRTGQDIDAAFSLMQKAEASSCVSVCEAAQTPYWMFHLTQDKNMKRVVDVPDSFSRRQDVPPSYVLNGAIYICQTEALKANGGFVAADTVAYEMPLARSIDIDTPEDLEMFRKAVEQTK